MTSEGTNDILQRAQKAANDIKEFGFDDAGGKAADTIVQQILKDLSGDSDSIEEANEKIESNKIRWSQSETGAGTAGSVLSRLQALGIIDEFPIGKIEVLDIHQFTERRQWILGHLMSSINGSSEQDEERYALNFIAKTESHAYVGQYAGDFAGYGLVDKITVPKLGVTRELLNGFAHGKIGVKNRSRNKGLEEEMIAQIEQWGVNNDALGIWAEHDIQDHEISELYKKIGYRVIGVYTGENKKGVVIVAKQFSEITL